METKKRPRDDDDDDDNDIQWPSLQQIRAATLIQRRPAKKPVYLVAELSSDEPSHSVFMVDAAAAVPGGHERRACTAAAGLPGATTHGAMSFVAVHSEQHGPGSSAQEEATPSSTTRPRRRRRSGVRTNAGSAPTPIRDPPPPLFPLRLRPSEFRHQPDVLVSSYAAGVGGTHILLSVHQLKGEEKPRGTNAFDVVEKTWEKVHDENLPFVGEAVPLGGDLFAANGAAAAVSVFHMAINIKKGSSSAPASSLLSVQELASASEGGIPRPICLLCPLGKGSFCSIRIRRCSSSSSSRRSRKRKITLTTYQIQGVKDSQEVAVQVKQQLEQTYQLKGPCRFMDSQMPVVAALSM